MFEKIIGVHMSKDKISPKTPTIVRNNPIAAATISKLNKSKKEPSSNPVSTTYLKYQCLSEIE